jgi:hypothetical protein
MPHGSKRCACCGATDGVQAHHLYSRKLGCPDDLTVWLCIGCRSRAHEAQHVMSQRIRDGQAAAKARGAKWGGSKPGVRQPDWHRGLAARRHKANAFALAVGPEIAKLRASGLSLRAIGARLDRRGIKTRMGARWCPSTVGNVLRRLEILRDAGRVG